MKDNCKCYLCEKERKPLPISRKVGKPEADWELSLEKEILSYFYQVFGYTWTRTNPKEIMFVNEHDEKILKDLANKLKQFIAKHIAEAHKKGELQGLLASDKNWKKNIFPKAIAQARKEERKRLKKLVEEAEKAGDQYGTLYELLNEN